MPEITALRARRGTGPAAWLLFGLLIAGVLAPVVANDRPILARVGGRIVTPALADLPLLGTLFASAETRSIDWGSAGPGVRILLAAPVPYSYRGIRLDEALRPPGRRHLLGTDALGRDLLARLIHGTRPSLAVGFGGTALALLLGGLLGGAAGLRGGIADLAVMRCADVVACFPPFILALAFVAAAGRGGLGPIVCAVALSRWAATARYIRGEILRHRGSDLWAAARATGGSLPGLAFRHLLPLLAPPLLVMAAFGVAYAIVLESGLSFVGLGVEPPAPSWGTILAEARGTLDAAWWPVFFPSLALLVVLGALCLAAERACGEPPGGLLA